MIIPVLLSGGSGSRLWPVSRESYPKQFLPLTGELSMLQQTFQRLDNLPHAAPVVVCNQDHRFILAEQLRQIAVQPSAIVLEPVPRNTAPAVAVAALQAARTDPSAVLLVLPADHVIADGQSFCDAVESAVSLAQEGYLVTFGIVPSHPETGYGYICRGDALSERAFSVARFVEKPSADLAEKYCASGDYFWNSGMFLFRADALLEEMERSAPQVLEAAAGALKTATADMDFLRLNDAAFAAGPSISIDYAVMEHTQRAVVVSLDCGWSDVGAWSALWESGARDADGNVARGDVLLQDCSNSYVHGEHRLIAGIGLHDMIVVETPDAVLVAPRDSAQAVKSVVELLKQRGREEATAHRRVYRPWGSYEPLVEGPRFQVKRIVVNPGAKLSLQMHHHRAEHWVVVRGTAEVTCGDKVFVLAEDQSTYIPLGQRHRLANPGRIPLELIEIQSGSYLGEDDIVRYEDIYGRGESC
jgi:mannose-1-phosphate guanylyltransferase/mannose-6-phosphate isomerase